MKKLTLLAALLVAISVIAPAATRSKKSEISRNLDIFNALYKELQTFYVDSIDAEKSINTAIAAMLNDIDPYTEYFSAKEQDQFRTMTTGEYGGIGSVIQQTPKGVVVVEPYKGSPAQQAGLRPGDIFLQIDGDTVSSWTSDKVSEKLKGQSGSTLKLVMKRPWVEDSILNFELKRGKIQMPSVPYVGMIRPGIGYVGLTTFSEKSYPEVRAGVEQLIKDGAKGLILDLRGNGGGLVESAVEILGMFLPKGTTVLTTRGKGVLNEKVYRTSVNPVDTKIPLAVLVDGSSASASEIVTGALQDLDRAVVIGNRSFGKGLVQSTRELPYDGLLKVTVAKYYIPSGRLIQAIDYSHRNPDGTVARIPDSLTSVFKTAGGREVRDGGGITPDIKIEYPEVNRMTFNVVRDNWAFDFANKYAAEHDTVASPETFEVTDEIYEQFKNFIDPAKFNYDKVCENAIEQLREIAKVEGYMNDSTSAQFDILASMLKHDLKRDLDLNRKNLSPYIAREILNRYYFNRGEVIYSLRDDEAVDSAVEILSTPRFDEILGKKQ
ncbi:MULTISPECIES: S41 family peptidase [Duncaniella]|jgi:carboxyl-terminal processing protease|uniref:S41 family peptidase n=1 Tax=Duncaniella TaxID=2518495 RepID=UPI000A49319B|nr:MULTISPECIES: S41 family peptidase [Duncaniella]MBJ2190826.1 S41 family peptidase [Muribaculaceae bacterium]MCX4284875.1 S41 family peptidase [Duncaniella dubosii]ROS89903.1 S41 family peptidase [Muribaculaceae bacterium Isolate-080 (Janvier)]HBN62667.1 peptidase S41 [Porphyromonadaceae bacterium]